MVPLNMDMEKAAHLADLFGNGIIETKSWALWPNNEQYRKKTNLSLFSANTIRQITAGQLHI